MKSRQLLCTFSTIDSYRQDIRKISKLYSQNRIKYFVFENENIKKDIYITYNIEIVSGSFEKYPSTISIHRKKETSTLYTLNSMNKLITEENNGVFDKTFNLNWALYKNCLILTGDVSVRIINIKLIDLIN